jgi:hypothetical protein
VHNRLTIGPGGLRRVNRSSPLQDLAYAPPFIAAQGPAFHDQHAVTHVTLIAFIMGLDFSSAAQKFLVLRMDDGSLKGNHYGLLHLIADHHTVALFP